MRVSVLGSITFSEIMEFYPKHNHSVYEELKNACRQGYIIPFVGAGLSVFCGYQGWPEVLKQLAKYVYDPSIRAGIETLIDKGELLQAAQEIQDNYPLILKMLQKLIDYDKVKNCSQDVWHASAAYVLPYLFHSTPVMTTNFDRVLEEVYDKCRAKFGKVITPYEPDLLVQSRQNNPHCLFKLHGDIGPEIHDIERLVFTQTQYDKAYASDGRLMQELPQWFQSKKLLFLGCSLEKDKTMDVLQQVMRKNPGLDHYAILACHPDDIPQRCVELGNWGISAIYYPDGKHEAVRVILERLLEDVNHSAYEELCRYAEKSVSASRTESRFMYNSNYITFVGRKEEIAQLQEFCRSGEQISWWAVTGPGGMGKSRLIYEFTNAQKADGWNICWLKHGDYENLSHWTPPVDRCIVVADDVQAHLQTIGDWIISISARLRSEKLRIILLERDGNDLDSAKWAELLQSESPYDDTISSKCYCSDFLNLTSLSDDELKAIMMDFAKASGKPLVDGEHAQRLLETLKNIDGDLQRPIYALAITDAWCSGKDPARWSKEQVLDTLVVRELKFYYDRLHSLSTDKISKETRSELENLLAQSCLVPFLPLNQIADDKYPKLHKRADKSDLSLHELLRQIGIVHKIEVHVQIKDEDSEKLMMRKDIIEAIVLDCPDLIKEYLVLYQAFDKGRLELLFPEDWDNDPMQLLFFRRVLIDYPEKLDGNDQFGTAFFAGDPKSEFPAPIYADLLFGATVRLPKMKKQAMDRLEKLYYHFRDNEDVAVEYAKGLVNLSANQTLEDCTRSIDKLRQLYEQVPTSEKLAVVYAKGVVNLSAEQSLKDCAYSVDKLRQLHEQSPANQELAVEYAKSLVNLSLEQPEEDDIQKNVHQSKKLLLEHPQNAEIQLAYAQTLFNLTLKQEPEALRRTAAQLREFLLAHSEANQGFQDALDTYLKEHPDHTERYASLRV